MHDDGNAKEKKVPRPHDQFKRFVESLLDSKGYRQLDRRTNRVALKPLTFRKMYFIDKADRITHNLCSYETPGSLHMVRGKHL